MKLIERLILETASEEDLNLEQFIESVRKTPDDWYAFRRHELMRFVESILSEAAVVSDRSEIAPTGATLEQLRQHFGLSDTSAEVEIEEVPVDWNAFKENF